MSEWEANGQYLEYLRGLLNAACTVHDTLQQREITKVCSQETAHPKYIGHG